ncbi:hypothetical protein ACT691_06155, partial [Vibrio metschnikovii]
LLGTCHIEHCVNRAGAMLLQPTGPESGHRAGSERARQSRWGQLLEMGRLLGPEFEVQSWLSTELTSCLSNTVFCY